MVNGAAPGAFIKFATVAEWVSKTAAEAQTVALLSQYFAQLRDDQLQHAVRYFAGQALSLRERPIPPIGEVTLLSAFSILTGAEPADLAVQFQQLGDLAEVAAQLMLRRSEPVLTLEDVAIALEQLAKTKGKRRLGWVVRLLERATAPEAKCLTQLILGSLQIDRAEQTVEAALAQMSNQPPDQIEWVHILLGDLGKTAVLARHGQLEQAQMQLFQPLKFMLASTVSEPLQLIQRWTEGFAVETKYDGLRVQAHIAPADRLIDLQTETVVAGIRVALFSRNLTEITPQFPDLIVPLAALEPRALVSGERAGLILDGEIVPCQADQLLPFAALQPRLDRPESTAAIAAVPVTFIAYDLLYKDGVILLNQPYHQRRAALETLALETLAIETPRVQLATAQTLSLEALTARLRARAAGDEGMMVKALQSRYRPGRHSTHWLKLKRAAVTLDVVVTAVEAIPAERAGSAAAPPDSRFSFSIAVRASLGDPSLLGIGKVSTGLDAAQLTALADWVEQHTLEEFAEGRVCLVEPQIVLEVAFERLWPSAQSKSGYWLEQPRIVRIRDDKPMSEIDSRETLALLAAGGSAAGQQQDHSSGDQPSGHS